MTEQETNGDARLEVVQKQFEGWRKSRTKKGPMPAELWAEAIALAREIGVGKVADGLGMSHGALSRRVDPSKPRKPRRAIVRALSEFVELTPMAAASTPTTVIELTSATGSRLTIRMSQGVDVGALMAGFQARQ